MLIIRNKRLIKRGRRGRGKGGGGRARTNHCIELLALKREFHSFAFTLSPPILTLELNQLIQAGVLPCKKKLILRIGTAILLFQR